MSQLNRTDTPLFTIEHIREMEHALFRQRDSFTVMQQAAQALYELIVADYPTAQAHVHVLLGAGNNAGDGLVVATLLKNYGFCVHAYSIFGCDFHGDAQKAYDNAVASDVCIEPFYPFEVEEKDIIVEAIFGIGLDRPAEGIAKTAIEHINACRLQKSTITVYAVDNPAGIIMDTGALLGTAVQADKTVTFVGDKVGLHTSDGKGYAGEIIVDTLGSKALSSPTHFRYSYDALPLFPEHNVNKGDFGHVLVVGGGQGMFGATALASVSSLKVGAGKSSVHCHHDYLSQFHLNSTPLYEVMRKDELCDLELYSAVVLGVGLGRDEWGAGVFEKTLNRINKKQPLLIDADGLWHLANRQELPQISIMTPHEAEASRLLNCSIKEIRDNKPQKARDLATKYNCIAVLKGAGTLISDGTTVWINTSGNMCLATAGTGDVLAGMIGGYLARGFNPLDAALYGVFRHGQAADKYLAKHGDKTMRASDLWEYL